MARPCGQRFVESDERTLAPHSERVEDDQDARLPGARRLAAAERAATRQNRTSDERSVRCQWKLAGLADLTARGWSRPDND